jgi:hypothetical protein
MPHSTFEITVGGGYTNLFLPQHTHVPADAGSAGGGREHAAGVDKYLRESQIERRPGDLLRTGYNNYANVAVGFPTLEYLRRPDKILQPAVGAGPDKNLIDFDIFYFRKRADVIR